MTDAYAFAVVLALVGAGLLVTYAIQWHGAAQLKSANIAWPLVVQGNVCRWGGLLCLGAAVVLALLQYF